MAIFNCFKQLYQPLVNSRPRRSRKGETTAKDDEIDAREDSLRAEEEVATKHDVHDSVPVEAQQSPPAPAPAPAPVLKIRLRKPTEPTVVQIDDAAPPVPQSTDPLAAQSSNSDGDGDQQSRSDSKGSVTNGGQFLKDQLAEPAAIDDVARPSPVSTASLDPRASHRNSISSASQRSRSDSKDSTAAGQLMKERLHTARRECHRNSHNNFIVPRCKQDELITESAIANDIQIRYPDIDRSDAVQKAQIACQSAKQLYATLAYMKKGPELCPLLEEGLCDKDLPLLRKPNARSQFALERRSGIPIKALEYWSDKHLEKFDRVQWWMTAPVFREREHYELEDKAILPFIPFNSHVETQEAKQGGYSEVYPVRIHPAHHEFWEPHSSEDEEPLVAVKQLFSHDDIEFWKEESILKALGSKNHPHLIKLLATYRQKQCYHLMFPYADANLKKYWEDRPTPSFDRDTVLWSLKQMTGIANGLLLIHKFTVTFPLKVAGAADGQGNVRLPKGVKLSVTPGEEMYGRHGDIKPENVLWFSKTSNTTDRMGVLQIADFGLGRFHGRDSRSGVNPDGVMSSLTYEPPECKLREPVSRAYDIWSLGCLYLEYITWLLKGNEDIEKFSDFRGEDNPSTGINDDNFFTITTNRYGRTEGKVRDGVKAWVDQLHGHEKCSALIHDILNLTMNELLIIDSQDRCNASWLYSQMALFQKKAQHDLEYLLKSVPRQTKPNTDRTNSAPEIAMDSKTNVKVHFTNSQKEKNQASTRPQSKTQSNIKPPNLHKDLVQRGPNTPGLRQGPHPTW